MSDNLRPVYFLRLPCECTDPLCNTYVDYYEDADGIVFNVYDEGNGISVKLKENAIKNLIDLLEGCVKKGGGHGN